MIFGSGINEASPVSSPNSIFLSFLIILILFLIKNYSCGVPSLSLSLSLWLLMFERNHHIIIRLKKQSIRKKRYVSQLVGFSVRPHAFVILIREVHNLRPHFEGSIYTLFFFLLFSGLFTLWHNLILKTGWVFNWFVFVRIGYVWYLWPITIWNDIFMWLTYVTTFSHICFFIVCFFFPKENKNYLV